MGKRQGQCALRKAPPPRRRRRYSIRAAAEKDATTHVYAAFLATFGYTRLRRSDAWCRNRQHEGLGRDGGADRRPGRAAARREYRRYGARHGEFRPVAAAAGHASAILAQ